MVLDRRHLCRLLLDRTEAGLMRDRSEADAIEQETHND